MIFGSINHTVRLVHPVRHGKMQIILL